MYVAGVLRNLVDELRAVARGRSPTHARLRDRLVGLAVVTVGVDLVCAVLAWALERDVKGTQIADFGTALFWTSTQLLTVSSSIQNPLSTPGRVLDVAMEAYAVTIVATLAGALGAFLVRRAHELEDAGT